MKRLYWRPQRVSRSALLIVTVIALGGLTATERLLVRRRQPFYADKLEAARLAARAMEALKVERVRLGIPLDSESDPAASGLIGHLMSPITSHAGVLSAKQTSANPNFAAVIVHMLKKAGVEAGDPVAMGFSGSFPALNVAAAAAVQVLGARPLTISSVAASQWGANDPHFSWLDMERVLNERRLLTSRSLAASRGGIEDRGLGMSKDGRRLLDEIIGRSGLPVLQPGNFDESVEMRMQLYEEQAAGMPIRAYVNIGGGTSSVGTRVGKKMFRPGLNLSPPWGSQPLDSVMSRFVHHGVPVIHMVRIDELARRYGLPLQPRRPPTIGQGSVFEHEDYNRWLAAGVLLAVLVAMVALIRLDLGFRVLHSRRSTASSDPPEQMV